MTDYHPLIARAVDGLDRSTGEARRMLYERARNALVTQLRSVEPALSESEITKERLALEEAIRKVEAEAARKSRTDPRPPPAPMRRDRASVPPDKPSQAARPEARKTDLLRPKQAQPEPKEPEAPPPAVPATARERLLSARTTTLTQEGIRGFRNVVNEVHDLGASTAKSAPARDTRDSYGSGFSQQILPAAESNTPSPQNVSQQQFDAEEFDSANDPRFRSLEQTYDLADEPPSMPQSTRPLPPRASAEEEYVKQRPARSYRGLIRLLVVLIILGGVAATVSWQWPRIMGLYEYVAHFRIKPASQTAHEPPTAEPKFPGRVPQDQNQAQAPGTAAPPTQAPVPAVAQRVVLYEEDPNDPQGRRFVGSAIWRTETVSPGAGLAPELAVRADVEIPERRMTVTWSLRRNTDQALPASHTIEIMFNLPADFPGGGIANVPGVLMKQSEQARGTPLAGLAVKVTNGFFLVGLSAVAADMQRNIQLLKERPWFDIPVVYTNGGRAILALEKGPPGDRAFADAFAAWEKK